MRFCPEHWRQLREAINARGLGALVAESGVRAASNLADELEHGPTVDNFDPLMGAHNAIVNQAMSIIGGRYQQNPLMLFADETEHPDWACPICALDWCHDEHNRLCTQEGCDWPREFDWAGEMVNGAADYVLDEWKRLGGG